MKGRESETNIQCIYKDRIKRRGKEKEIGAATTVFLPRLLQRPSN